MKVTLLATMVSLASGQAMYGGGYYGGGMYGGAAYGGGVYGGGMYGGGMYGGARRPVASGAVYGTPSARFSAGTTLASTPASSTLASTVDASSAAPAVTFMRSPPVASAPRTAVRNPYNVMTSRPAQPAQSPRYVLGSRSKQVVDEVNNPQPAVPVATPVAGRAVANVAAPQLYGLAASAYTPVTSAYSLVGGVGAVGPYAPVNSAYALVGAGQAPQQQQRRRRKKSGMGDMMQTLLMMSLLGGGGGGGAAAAAGGLSLPGCSVLGAMSDNAIAQQYGASLIQIIQKCDPTAASWIGAYL